MALNSTHFRNVAPRKSSGAPDIPLEYLAGAVGILAILLIGTYIIWKRGHHPDPRSGSKTER